MKDCSSSKERDSGLTHDATPTAFILSAFDRQQWCPVLQARFEVADLASLRTIIGLEAEKEPKLRYNYALDAADLQTLSETFGVALDPSVRLNDQMDVILFREERSSLPYLPHTGYELPLLLDGRKKLARIGQNYPPVTFEGEDRFDHWVDAGKLSRVEILEPLETPVRGVDGLRTVYYTVKGEEWRVPAMRLIWEAAGKSGGWNENFERLEGMLFGYEDWQNDWWIADGLRRGGFSGASLCCPVNAEGLAWIESAGFRALPPCAAPCLTIRTYDHRDDAGMRAFMCEKPNTVALARFNVPLWPAREILPLSADTGRWEIPQERLPELNRHLRNNVTIVLRRDDHR